MQGKGLFSAHTPRRGSVWEDDNYLRFNYDGEYLRRQFLLWERPRAHFVQTWKRRSLDFPLEIYVLCAMHYVRWANFLGLARVLEFLLRTKVVRTHCMALNSVMNNIIHALEIVEWSFNGFRWKKSSIACKKVFVCERKRRRRNILLFFDTIS